MPCNPAHFCPACHQRLTSPDVCQPVPHRQPVFTIPKNPPNPETARNRPSSFILPSAPAADTLELRDQSADQAWKAPEVDLGDGRILVLESTE